MRILLLGSALLFLIPVFAFAAELADALRTIGDLVNGVIPIVAGLALLFFFWGVALYILNEGNAEKKGQGRSIMLWGVIAMFVIFSIFGLVAMLQNTFNISSLDRGTCGIDTDGNLVCF